VIDRPILLAGLLLTPGPGLATPIEPGFADRILPCADAALSALGIGDATACHAVAPKRPAGCHDRALRGLASLIFNLCAGRVQTSCPVAGGSGCAARTLGEALAEIAALLHQGDCPRASSCAAPRAGEATDQDGGVAHRAVGGWPQGQDTAVCGRHAEAPAGRSTSALLVP
jgi:hypothetical protein